MREGDERMVWSKDTSLGYAGREKAEAVTARAEGHRIFSSRTPHLFDCPITVGLGLWISSRSGHMLGWKALPGYVVQPPCLWNENLSTGG